MAVRLSVLRACRSLPPRMIPLIAQRRDVMGNTRFRILEASGFNLGRKTEYRDRSLSLFSSFLQENARMLP
jgi:hypothetical protein